MKSVSLIRVLAALFWLALAVTVVMALLPHPPQIAAVSGDKTLHVIAFATLTLMASAAFPRRSAVELFAALAALGAVIEVLQMIPALGRDAEFADWVTDCVAVAITLGIVTALRKIAGLVRRGLLGVRK